ncbi:MAG: hypothetical protein DSY57_06510 [Desulfobulbus sp.]|nr:MAG: hypothetical protein DSY57_06510 [Desulfobulbus sp.]
MFRFHSLEFCGRTFFGACRAGYPSFPLQLLTTLVKFFIFIAEMPGIFYCIKITRKKSNHPVAIKEYRTHSILPRHYK